MRKGNATRGRVPFAHSPAIGVEYLQPKYGACETCRQCVGDAGKMRDAGRKAHQVPPTSLAEPHPPHPPSTHFSPPMHDSALNLRG